MKKFIRIAVAFIVIIALVARVKYLGLDTPPAIDFTIGFSIGFIVMSIALNLE